MMSPSVESVGWDQHPDPVTFMVSVLPQEMSGGV